MVYARKKHRNSENRGISSNKGFTLIELLVVTVIIGILASIGLSSFAGFRESAKITVSVAEIKDLEREIVAHVLEKGTYPAVATWLSDIKKEGLVDPWGQPYVYAATGTRTMGGPLNADFDLYSKGSDGNSAADLLDPTSRDDIVRLSEGSFIGLASKF